MITGKADPTLDPMRLERAVAGFRRQVAAVPRWFFREKYVDRGPLDPFYILDYRTESEVDTAGDDLMGEPLFATALPGVTVKRMTREPEGEGGSYWRPIEAGDLVHRLDRFLTMYREDCLQPPGYRGDLHEPTYRHPRFEKKKFVYRVGPSTSAVVGVGSRIFAGQGLFGAIRGRLLDEGGEPVAGALILANSQTGTLERHTDEEGFFRFSRLAEGAVRLTVEGRETKIERIDSEDFGSLRGSVEDTGSQALAGVEVVLEAPDGETFRTVTDASGSFSILRLPVGSYALRIPGYRFDARTGPHEQGERG